MKLTKEERVIVNEIRTIIRKYKYLGPLKIVECLRRAVELTRTYDKRVS